MNFILIFFSSVGEEPTATKEQHDEKQKKGKVRTQDYYKEALEEDEDFNANTIVQEGIIKCTEEGCSYQCVEEDEVYARSHRSKHTKQKKKKVSLCKVC